MAESNAALNRSLHLHRDTQFAAAAIYQQLYGKTDPETGKKSVPATFQVKLAYMIFLFDNIQTRIFKNSY